MAGPGIAHYGASKAGLNQLTSVMAIELRPHDIRVNAILPGLIGTERVLAGIRGGALPPGEHEAKLAKIPLGSMGRAEVAVNLALYSSRPRPATAPAACSPRTGASPWAFPAIRDCWPRGVIGHTSGHTCPASRCCSPCVWSGGATASKQIGYVG